MNVEQCQVDAEPQIMPSWAVSLILSTHISSPFITVTLHLPHHWQCFGENWKHLFRQSYPDIIM